MLIVGITDIHNNRTYIGKLQQFIKSNNVELILCAGDISLPKIIDELLSFGINIYAVSGNMDDFELESALAEKDISLGGKMKIINDVCFLGISGNHITEHISELRKLKSDIEKNKLKILVTHYPPLKTKIDRAFIGMHIGSKEVYVYILESQPWLSFSGHVHESPGVAQLGNTIIANPGAFKSGNFLLIDTSNKKVEVKQFD